MAATIVTTDDLHEFKKELFEELKKLFSEQNEQKEQQLKKYLKSSEVMDVLQISAGTLQHLRRNGTLPYVKIKGLIYFKASDIQKTMDNHRIQHNSGFTR